MFLVLHMFEESIVYKNAYTKFILIIHPEPVEGYSVLFLHFESCESNFQS
jgi:hypothetical protein